MKENYKNFDAEAYYVSLKNTDRDIVAVKSVENIFQLVQIRPLPSQRTMSLHDVANGMSSSTPLHALRCGHFHTTQKYAHDNTLSCRKELSSFDGRRIMSSLADAMTKKDAILRDKKAKIAEELEHVQEVLLRKRLGELVKAERQRTNIELSLTEACRKRRQTIMEQVDHCAARVERAKNIALSQRERHTILMNEKRQQLEKRLKDASTRVEQARLQRYPTLQHLRTEKEKHAALVIYSHWRTKKLAPLILSFKEFNCTVDRIRCMSFDDCTAMLRNEKLLKCIDEIIKRLLKNQTPEKKIIPIPKNCNRIFLSSYLMVSNEHAIFQNIGLLERDLQHAAEYMLTSFEAFVQHPSIENQRKLTETWYHFLKRFTEWKSNDAKIIEKFLKQQTDELNRLWDSVKVSDPQSAPYWGIEIDAQKQQMENQLRSLQGYRNHLTSSKQMPLIATGIDSEKVDDTLCDFPKSIPNLELAHEIAVNPEFTFKKQVSKDGLEASVRQVMTRLYFDEFKKTDTRIPSFLRAFEELKNSLIVMLPRNETIIREAIQEKLDMKVLEQQAKHSVVNVDELLSFFISTMAKLCAPARDEEIAKLQNVADSVDKLEGIYKTLENMKLDMANFQLEIVKPIVSENSVAYERDKFRGQPKERTACFLRRTYDRVGKVALKDLFNHCCVDLLMPLPSSSSEPTFLPETFALDENRICLLRDDFQLVIIVSMLMNLMMANVGQLRRVDKKRKAQFLESLLAKAPTSVNLPELILACLTFVKTHVDMTESAEKELQSVLIHAMSLEHRVLMTLSQKCRSHLFTFLREGQLSLAILTSSGLGGIELHFIEICKQVASLVNHHWRVHEPLYQSLYKSFE